MVHDEAGRASVMRVSARGSIGAMSGGPGGVCEVTGHLVFRRGALAGRCAEVIASKA